jgi:hypothetical protein
VAAGYFTVRDSGFLPANPKGWNPAKAVHES